MGNKNKNKKATENKTVKSQPIQQTEPSIIQSINKFYIYGIIFLFAFILYANTIPNDYALDDAVVITNNHYTQQGFSGIKDIFSYDSFKGFNESMLNGVQGGRYRPLSIATFAVENHFWGNNPHISHFINILLYAFTCVLLYIILSEFLKKYSHTVWYLSIPFIATMLFAAHPIHTEVVANIKSRDEIMSFMFSLFSIWFLLKYVETKKIIFILLTCISYFLALLSKEIAVVFILIFSLSFYFFSEMSIKKIIQTILPLIIIAIAFVLMRQMIIGKTATNIQYVKDVMNDSFADMTSSQKYATIVFTLGVYLKLLFVPHPLTWDYYPYHIPKMEWGNGLVLISLLIYGFLIFYSIKNLKEKRFFSYCILFFLIPLSLTSNILFSVGAFMNERFLYASSVGFSLLIAYLIVVKPNKFFKSIFSKPLFFLIPVLLLYSFKTIDRNRNWKDSFTLIEHDYAVSFNSAKSNGEYASYLFNKAEALKDETEKIKYYEKVMTLAEKAFSIDKNKASTNFILGTLYGKYKHDLEKSIYYLNNAMHLDPNDIESYNNLGTAYGMQNNFEKAMETFQSGLKIAPQDVRIINNISLTYKLMGNAEKADEYAKIAMTIQQTKK